MATKTPPRVRIALSEAQGMHLGTARIALINYLFAVQNKGRIIVRIDNLDEPVEAKSFESNALDCLKWLGIQWDEGPDIEDEHGPYRQSERRQLYKPFIAKLLKAGKTYECYCTNDELEYARKQALRSGLLPVYNGKCKTLSAKEKSEYTRSGRKPVLRLRVPEGEVSFDDLILGEQHAETSSFGDFVVVKSDGTPMYNFAGILDDNKMQISHVIRGADNLQNTYRQLAIFKQLGIKPPLFAHIPLLLNPDKSRLSKRFGPIDIKELKDTGYVRETIIGMLATTLAPEERRDQHTTLATLIKEFRLDEEYVAHVALDRREFNKLNEEYIQQLSPSELTFRLRPFLTKFRFSNEKLLSKGIELIQNKIKRLDEVPKLLSFLFKGMTEYREEYFRYYSDMDVSEICNDLTRSVALLDALPAWTEEAIETTLTGFVESSGTDANRLYYAMKVSLTTSPVELGLFKILELLGKEETIKRVQGAIAYLGKRKK